jgi:beta-N-acetylhexosaminidase
MRRVLFGGLAISILVVSGFLLCTHSKGAPRPLNDNARSHWVDSIYNALSEQERIGQLFMVAAYSGGKNYNEEQINTLLKAHEIGGLIFMQGSPERQAVLTNQYQQAAQTPLLIAMDAEWGLGMRLDSVQDFPRQMMLGATRDTTLVYNMAAAIAAQCKRLGVHIDFAPVIDVNNNPLNPVINSRSFGQDKTWVAKLGVAYARGLQDNGIVACAKHFPGHGDTNVDSHKDLPVVEKTLAQLDTLELYPYRFLMRAGVKSIMVAHLQIPALDTGAHVPTTLSKNTVTGLLKNKMGYKGVVFTDALNMQGVAKYFPAGQDDLMAFEAGNDVLLFSQDVPLAISKIRNAIDSGIIPGAALEQSVKKILGMKYDAGLSKPALIDTAHLLTDLNKQVPAIRRQAAREAITLVKDDNGIWKKINENMHIGYFAVNTSDTPQLYRQLEDEYTHVSLDFLPKGSSGQKAFDLLEKVSRCDVAIVGIHNVSFLPYNNYGLGEEAIYFLEQAGDKNNTLLTLMGNAYALQHFCNAKSALVCYEDDSIIEDVAADMLIRKIKPRGKLPVSPCVNFPQVKTQPLSQAQGLRPIVYEMKKTDFLPYAGIVDRTALDRLDIFLQRCVADGVFPGCRVLAAKDGKVFYDKAFGYYTYDKVQHVDTNTLYDMASCTKMLATTLAVMKLYEDGKLRLDKTIGDYLPSARGTDKATLLVKNLLLHQAGLKAWIPFYKETIDSSGRPLPQLYRKNAEKDFSIQVAKNLYLRNDWRDTIWNRIYASPLENNGKSVYSDLDYYFLAAIVEKITGTTVDKYVEEQFYKPLGLKRILFKPLEQYDSAQIAPTEDDIFWRQQVLEGYVHDPGAAMFGGVAGHAGLFATADDAAAIMQLLLNKGSYHNRRFFRPETVELFTAYGSTLSHRGLGFDKPATDADSGGPAGDRTSGLAFGHQGFTGTCAWADPANGIVFVFLSNRVYPSASNTKINQLNVRTTAQDYIYEALGIPTNHNRQDVYKAELKLP